MEDLSYISFPWSTNKNQYDHLQEIEETFIFSSQNNFLNPVTPTATGHRQMGRRHLPPARLDAIDAPSIFCSSGFHGGKNVIPTTNGATAVSGSGTTVAGTTATTTTVAFPAIYSNPNMSSDQDDDGVASDCSPEKKTSLSDEDNPNPPRSKRPRSDSGGFTSSSTINFRREKDSDETDTEAIAQMKEMIYRAAVFRPVSFSDEEVGKKPRRRNVRISNDPQTVAARQRREKISERIRVLQKLVPGGDKMDTASMLDEAANYLKFLRSQVKEMEQFGKMSDYGRDACDGTSVIAYSTSGVDEGMVTLGVPFPMHAYF